MTLHVGITGGIGSGKSLVCHLFEILGVPIYYADDWAKWLLDHDPELRLAVVQALGPQAYTADGRYNRPWVAEQIFGHAEKLAALNALVHPAVARHSTHWQAEQAKNGAPYTVKEAALLIESGSYKALDFLIVVTAPEALRCARVQQRDGLTEQQVRARMAHQLPESEKVNLADLIIVNDGQRALIPQVWAAHQRILGRGMGDGLTGDGLRFTGDGGRFTV